MRWNIYKECYEEFKKGEWVDVKEHAPLVDSDWEGFPQGCNPYQPRESRTHDPDYIWFWEYREPSPVEVKVRPGVYYNDLYRRPSNSASYTYKIRGSKDVIDRVPLQFFYQGVYYHREHQEGSFYDAFRPWININGVVPGYKALEERQGCSCKDDYKPKRFRDGAEQLAMGHRYVNQRDTVDIGSEPTKTSNNQRFDIIRNIKKEITHEQAAWHDFSQLIGLGGYWYQRYTSKGYVRPINAAHFKIPRFVKDPVDRAVYKMVAMYLYQLRVDREFKMVRSLAMSMKNQLKGFRWSNEIASKIGAQIDKIQSKPIKSRKMATGTGVILPDRYLSHWEFGDNIPVTGDIIYPKRNISPSEWPSSEPIVSGWTGSTRYDVDSWLCDRYWFIEKHTSIPLPPRKIWPSWHGPLSSHFSWTGAVEDFSHEDSSWNSIYYRYYDTWGERKARYRNMDQPVRDEPLSIDEFLYDILYSLGFKDRVRPDLLLH